jgi:23S rRNA pseudouridine2605 synthase
MELVHAKVRVFPVGRLDWNTEGLLLLTNDGELTAKLTHASTHVPKTYMVKVAGHPTREDIQKLRDGVMIGGEGDAVPGKLERVRTAPAKVREVREGDNPWFEVTLIEGRNRQIRRMFEAIGHHVEKIKRVRYGPLELDVPPGVTRELRPHEVETLQKYVSEPATALRERAGMRETERQPMPKAAGLPSRKSFAKSKNFRFRDAGPRREFAPRGERDARPPRFSARPEQPGNSERGGVRRYAADGAEIPYEPPARPERPAFGGKRFGGPKKFGKPFGEKKAFGDRPPRREFGARPPRREFGDRPPRREFAGAEGGERPKRFGGPKRFGAKPFGDKKPFGRKPFGDRPPRKEFGDRPPRREFAGAASGERPKRFGGPKKFGAKPFGARPPRREFGDRPPRREFGARPPRREFGAGEGGERPKRFGAPKTFGAKPFGKTAGGPKTFGPKRFGKPAGGPKTFGPKRFGKPAAGGRKFGARKLFGAGPRSDRGPRGPKGPRSR